MTFIAYALQVALIPVLPSFAQDAEPAAEQPATPPVTVIEEAADAEFNLQIPLTFAADSADAPVVVRFAEQESGERLELRVNRDGAALASVGADQESLLADAVPITVAEDGAALLILRQRIDKLGLVDGHRAVLSVWRDGVAGKLSIQGPAGAFTPDDVYYQPYAPPEFTDDFMRGEEDSTGEWETLAGTWGNTALVDSLKFVPKAANSFAFSATPDPFAMALAGSWFWDDMRCSVAVRMNEPGLAGLAFRADGQERYYALTLEFGSAEDPEHALLKLKKVTGEREEVLAQDARGIPIGQWYRLGVAVLDNIIEASLDGIPLFEVADDSFALGRIGLLASNGATVYLDDVEARAYLGFRDDFEENGLGRWHKTLGDWQVAESKKADDRCLTAAGKGEALACAGRDTWTDYQYDVDVRHGRGSLGLCFLRQSAEDYWLWRYVPSASRHELVRARGGVEEVLDYAPLELPSKAWHPVSVRAGEDFVRVDAGGKRPLDALLPGGGSGRVGVWLAKGARADFDNVDVSFPPGYVPPRIPATMAADAEMSQQFTNPAEGWFSVTDEAHQPQAVGMNWNKGEYFDPVDIAFPITGVVAAAGKVTVTIEGDQTGTGGGYQLTLATEENSPKLALKLSAGEDVLKEGEAEVAESGECRVRFGRRGSYVVAYIDDALVLHHRLLTDGPTPPPATEPATEEPPVEASEVEQP